MAGPLSQRLARLAAGERTEALLRHVGDAWAEQANALAPEGRERPEDEGQDTENAERQRLKGGITFEVESPTRGYLVLPHQALYVLFGTRAHIIRPKAGRQGRNKRPPSLAWSTGSTPYFAREVHHPGTQANDFARRAFASPAVQEAITAAMSALVS